MNSIWNKNLNLFKNRFQPLFSMLQKDIESFSNNINASKEESLYPFWKISECKNGMITAEENGLRLHSAYNPEREAQTLITSISDEMSEKNALAFCGFGLGYAAISASEFYADKTLILIEPDINHFLSALALVDFEKVFAHSSLIFEIGCQTDQAISILNSIGLKNIKFLSNKNFQIHSREYFEVLEKLIERNLEKEKINDATLEKFRKLWFRNSLRNIEKTSLLEGINIYKDKGSSLPFLILAAGPSLGDILPHLKSIQNKVITVCVDTALKACLRVDFQPDFIILTDPQYWAYRHIAGLKSPKSILVIVNEVYPSVFNFNCKKIIQSASQLPIGTFFEKRIKEPGSLGAGGSVASCAWNFANYCGGKEIYLIGLDLGFPERQTHIKGSTFEEAVHTSSKRTKPGETSGMPLLFSGNACIEKNYDGNDIVTDQRMKMFAWWFESRISSCPESKTMTLSKKGLKIPGVQVSSIEKLLSIPDIKEKRDEFLSLKDCSSLDRKKLFLSAKALFNDELSKAEEICNKALDLLFTTDFSNAKDAFLKEAAFETFYKELSNLKIASILSLVVPTSLKKKDKKNYFQTVFSSIKNFAANSTL